MNKHHEVNREGWNKRTEIHFKHPEYKVKEFLEGAVGLHPLEREELGDVTGKTLLHLQCHFGLDTLSWARLGAKVTGIDISDRSIERANELKEKSGLDARFIRTDLFDLPDVLDDKFDIVYTSYGVTWWMSDINRWAKIAASYVKKGGVFYMAEIHPTLCMLDGEKKIHEPYFNQPGAEHYKDEGDYCDKDVKIDDEYGWRWTLGDVITALIKAGLTIEFLHEFPFCVYDAWPTMVKDGAWWYYPDRTIEIPMTFSVMARKL
jgi:SAM-dependent methyltransferase